jgi:hypothetical protein
MPSLFGQELQLIRKLKSVDRARIAVHLSRDGERQPPF